MLDLNNPHDAEIYVLDWIAKRDSNIERDKLMSLEIEDGTPEDTLMLAKQLFLYCDEREPLGSYDRPH